ncbi:MAG: T9SS type A sorting domain-containing protein, partial [Bacteroidota bacterium]
TSYTIAVNPEIVVTSTSTNTCVGESTGAISLNVSGGTPPFSYRWDDGSEANELSGLFADEYCVLVTDAAGCEKEHCAKVDNFPELQANLIVIDDCGEPYTRGRIAVSISGGDAPFTFNWNTGNTTQSIDNLDIGAYAVTVTDAYGCTLSLSANVQDGLVVFNSTDPCAIITLCNGEEVDKVDFDEDCGYYDPSSCIMWECYCTLTNEFMFAVEHRYEEEYFDNEFCEYVGVCPDDEFDDAPWWGEEVIESGTLVSEVVAVIEECPDGYCYICTKREFCDYPELGETIFDPNEHEDEFLQGVQPTLVMSSVNNNDAECESLCSAIYKCGDEETERICIPLGIMCPGLPSPLTGENDAELYAKSYSGLADILIVYNDEQDIIDFEAIKQGFINKEKLGAFKDSLKPFLIEDRFLDLEDWLRHYSGISLILYPNPTNDKLYLEILTDNNKDTRTVESIELVNMAGEKISRLPVFLDRYTVNLETLNLSSGIYMLKIRYDNGRTDMKRFVYQSIR